MLVRIAEGIEHQHRIGHRRKDRTEAGTAVQALADEVDGLVDGATAQRARHQRFGMAQQHIHDGEQAEPDMRLMARAARRLDVGGRTLE